MSTSFESRAATFRDRFFALQEEIGRHVVGQRAVTEAVLTCLFAGGNVLIEGVPGLGKTLLVRSLSAALDLPFSRVQFTPDLMPADIIGTEIIQLEEDGRRSLRFRKGPLFAQIVLADEVNRATPKTQSALLEAMQEHRITVGGTTHALEEPFIVLATQNPLEMEGTYVLPEAQLDRFLMKIIVPFTTREELNEVVTRTTGAAPPPIRRVMGRDEVLEAQATVREVAAAPEVVDYAVRLVLATHPELAESPEPARRWLRWGSSPRGAQALLLAAKVHALVAKRFNASFHDVQRVALDVLRHRVALAFEAEADGMTADRALKEIMEKVETPRKALVG